MGDLPGRKVEAAGARSVAAEQIGVAATGDEAHIDARTTNLVAGAIPEPAKVAPPPAVHNLPRRPAQVFVGRSTALGQLHGALAEDTQAVVTQAVYGLGGVGKSELALHHAEAHRADYSLIWWITAEDRGQIQAGLAALAARLCREIALVGTTTDAAEWGLAWLQAHHGWLVILDNINEPEDVEQLLGQLTGGHILITTRRDTGWEQIAHPIRLDVLDPGPAAELITARTGRHSDADKEGAASIAAELGNLPLALDQAAAYITRTRITPAAYMQRLLQHPADMYAAPGSGSAQRTISRVWDITIEAIREHNVQAIELLHILACYAPDSVPRGLLGGNEGTDKIVVDEALAVLNSYSMITLTDDVVSMHRLVQAVILASALSDEEARGFVDETPLTTALEWLSDALPVNPNRNVAEWPLLRALVPHAERLAALFPASSQPVELAAVQLGFAAFQDSQGQYEQALALRQSALGIYETNLGPDNQTTVAALTHVAFSYWRLGRHTEALPLEKRALEITEDALGPDHVSMAFRLSNLATTYRELGQLDEAVPLYKRAIEIYEKNLGPDDQETAGAMDNLATTYTDLGQADKALPLQQRALEITEADLGADHPFTAIRLNNLASTYSRIRQEDKALLLRQRALEITEAALGGDHPSTAIRLNNLAFSHKVLGQVDKALPLQQRALEITEAALGEDHPSTAIIRKGLVHTYRELGQVDKAMLLEQRATAARNAD